MSDYELKAEKYEMNHFCDVIEEEPVVEIHDNGFIGENNYEIRIQTLAGFTYNQLYINGEHFNDDYDKLETIENLVEDLKNYERIIND